MRKCTGLDMRDWGADAIFEVRCRNCASSIEFFKDEITRNCPQCRSTNTNPRGDYGCGQSCSSHSFHTRSYCSRFKRRKARFYGRF